MTIVEEIIVEEMTTMDFETKRQLAKFIYKSARFLEASVARAEELSYQLIEYYF